MFANIVKEKSQKRTVQNSGRTGMLLRLSLASIVLIALAAAVVNSYISLNQQNELLARKIQETRRAIANRDREIKYRANQYAFESNREQLGTRIREFKLNLQAARLTQVRHLTLVTPGDSERERPDVRYTMLEPNVESAFIRQ